MLLFTLWNAVYIPFPTFFRPELGRDGILLLGNTLVDIVFVADFIAMWYARALSHHLARVLCRSRSIPIEATISRREIGSQPIKMIGV
jgi:hypothetical protein